MAQQKLSPQTKQMLLWILALVVGTAIGTLQVDWVNSTADFVASVYTRLFQLLAVPTIALAVITTLATFGKQKDTGRIFLRTIMYTLLTTFMAALVGLALYWVIAPDSLPAELIQDASLAAGSDGLEELSYKEHFLSVVPNNIVRPFLEGNVLSILLLSFAIGFGLTKMANNERKEILVKGFLALQDLLFVLIRGLVYTLPLGIVAFAIQLSAQVSAGVAVASIGKYVAVVLAGNAVQFFVVLPLFLLARRINPLKTFRAMTPAVLMALFTKSSAATLPVTLSSAEQRLKASPRVARFVLPICTTINMNGCAAFILITSLFVMQNGGLIPEGSSFVALIPFFLLWVVLSVFSAVGNAGVPMGCYFLTLSLMTGIGAPIAIMGIILPIYTIIDMVETAENVWSDSCVCAMVNHDIAETEKAA